MNVKHKIKNGQTLSLVVIQCGDGDAVKRLVHHGVNMYVKGNDDKTSTFQAVQFECEEGLKLILDQCLNIEQINLVHRALIIE